MSSQENVEAETKGESSDALVQKTICVSPDMKKACDMLIHMHTYKRPAGSKTERKFIHDFIQPLGVKMDKFGNYYKAIAGAPVIWASHTDTVHSKKGRQMVGFDKMEIGIAAEDKTDSNCLGADDTVGVWLMIQKIMEKQPGLYIFHRAEEGGRQGSRFIAKMHPDLLKTIDFAVAFDRKGTDNFITHQMSQRCCSDEFGESFIAELKKGGLDYKLDTTGSYTDTASYTELIAECTNISVGYSSAHSKNERLDLGHAFKLRDALLAMDVSKLVKKRKPGTIEYKSYGNYNGSAYNYGGSQTYGSHGGSDGFDGWGCMDGYGGAKHERSMRTAGTSDEDYDGAWVQDPKTGVWRIKPSTTMFNTTEKGTASGTQVGTRNGHKGSNLPVTKQNSELRKMFGGGTDTGRKPINLPALGPAKPASKPEVDDDEDEEDYAIHMAGMVKLVERNPEAVADILEQFGVTAEGLRDEILEMVGICNF